MTFGYIRVSKITQNLSLQENAIIVYSCDRIFYEKESAVKFRAEWEKLNSQLRDGDTIVIWKIDRLGRTAWEMIKLMEDLGNRNIRFVSITEGIDTATPMGKVWFQLNSILAQNERAVLIERTKAGLKAAKERGKTGGRPKGLTPDNEVKMKAVKKMYAANVSISEIRKALKISSNATIYKYINYK
ncbi:recombinase family protein (plasmid) [Mucilaginibacter sp. PAMB04274]|uniref:recombinase family protein n=1 Tax=Mucilaginibacter sp. PAMB04274 TaxID=3138568 RepID=UPI0031F67504